MRFAYADPPYLGLCGAYGHHHGDDGRCWDDLETHRLLIARIDDEFDGWALHLSQPSLRDILPLTPDGARVMAWCKSFASFKPGVHPAYAWEPVIVKGTRTRGRKATTFADYTVVPIVTQRGFFGAKPAPMVWWVLGCLNVQSDDEVVDLFPGSGAVTRAIESWQTQGRLAL